ncbi:nucleotidyltransferase domain-containing protein [Shouchella lonarensis]|uniref:Polymerase beta nucleotidyltransferase domain-containing protein n=1 Tax=Shouchella lonarensis TaxID=1464122 RepID=A0A1G6JNM8_9BACI|nr:nucleotidyltransferase domain-containing protein [Shouchella lonarensis]SDC20324.1 hypothetical protein SAMN05421737_10647 [Shouchella lonarensis]
MTSLWRKTGISTRFVSELQHFCAQHEHIDKVILFGSRARGDYRRTSDIDLAIVTKPISHSTQNLIAQAILDIPTPLKIDITFVDRLRKEALLTRIQKEGVVVYGQGQIA